MANAVILIGVSAYILFEAWQRLRQPPDVDALPMLLVACGGLLVTLVGVKLLHAGSQESLNVRGAFLEVLSDLFGAVGTIAAALVLLFTHWPFADVIASVFIGILILPRAWGLLRNVIDVLLESAPPGMSVEQIQTAICQVRGVRSAHDLHVRTITSGFVALSGHVLASERPSETCCMTSKCLSVNDLGSSTLRSRSNPSITSTMAPAARWTPDAWSSAALLEHGPPRRADHEASDGGERGGGCRRHRRRGPGADSGSKLRPRAPYGREWSVPDRGRLGDGTGYRR